MTQTTTRPTVERQPPGRRWIAAATVLLAVVAGVGIWLAAGSPPSGAPAADNPTSALTEEQATAVAASYFEGWNAGEYETTAVDLVAAQTDGYVTWRFTTRFEQEDGVEVRLTFPQDGTQISGAHILSDRLGTR